MTHKKVRFLRGTIRDSRATYPASCQTDLLWQCLKGSIKMVEEAGRKRRGEEEEEHMTEREPEEQLHEPRRHIVQSEQLLLPQKHT